MPEPLTAGYPWCVADALPLEELPNDHPRKSGR